MADGEDGREGGSSGFQQSDGLAVTNYGGSNGDIAAESDDLDSSELGGTYDGERMEEDAQEGGSEPSLGDLGRNIRTGEEVEGRGEARAVVGSLPSGHDQELTGEADGHSPQRDNHTDSVLRADADGGGGVVDDEPVIDRGAQCVTGAKLRLVKPSHQAEVGAIPPVSHQWNEVGQGSREAIKPLSATFHQIELEWRAEWKTTSKNRRPLVRRLYRKVGERWLAVTRAEVERGDIQIEGPLVVTLHNFTPAAAALVERKGKDAIKQLVQRIIDRDYNRRTG